MKIIKWLKSTWIWSEILDLVEDFKFWKIKRLANKCHSKFGTRFHVVPLGNDQLVVVDGNGVVYNDTLKPNGRMIRSSIGKKLSFFDIIRMSYYSTSVDSPVLRERAKPKK